MLRAAADIALFAGAAVLPWPITLIAGAFFAFKFKNYWEMPLSGLFIDILFYYPDFRAFGFFEIRIATFTIFLLVFFAAEYAKKYLKTG